MKISLGKKCFFNIFPQNIHCEYTLEMPGRRGGSNEYQQCMFWIKNKKGVGFKGVYISRTCFSDGIIKQVIPLFELFFFYICSWQSLGKVSDCQKKIIKSS